MVFNALSILREAFHGNGSLSLAEELGCRWQIRKKPQCYDASDDREGPEDQKDIHPPCEARIDVSDSISDQSVLMVKTWVYR